MSDGASCRHTRIVRLPLYSERTADHNENLPRRSDRTRVGSLPAVTGGGAGAEQGGARPRRDRSAQDRQSAWLVSRIDAAMPRCRKYSNSSKQPRRHYVRECRSRLLYSLHSRLINSPSAAALRQFRPLARRLLHLQRQRCQRRHHRGRGVVPLSSVLGVNNLRT